MLPDTQIDTPTTQTKNNPGNTRRTLAYEVEDEIDEGDSTGKEHVME